MPGITFDQLIQIYKNSELQADGRWRLRITDASILATLNLILTDQKALKDSQIHIDSSVADLAVGGFVDTEFQVPRIGLGVRAVNLAEIINTPDYRLREPSRWYLLEERFAYNDEQIPEAISKYRHTLRLAQSLSNVAAYVDYSEAEAVFFGKNMLKLPINYSSKDTMNNIIRLSKIMHI